METLIMSFIGLVGAEVTKKVASELATDGLSKFRSAWSRRFSKDLEPSDLSPAGVDAVLAAEPALSQQIQGLLAGSPVLRRIEKVGAVMQGARALWVDDHPEWNAWEVATLEACGVHVTTVETTRSALALVADGIDLVISDIAREGSDSAGLQALPELRGKAPTTPVIFYIGRVEGVPAGAFGAADKPDDLLQLVMDALERSRW